LRRPGLGAPSDAVTPADGEEWQMVRRAFGGGVFVGSQPSRYVNEIVPLPGTTTLEPARGVRLPSSRGEAPPQPESNRISDAPGERKTRSLAGWLVDINER
jgi:hypothetical protein